MGEGNFECDPPSLTIALALEWTLDLVPDLLEYSRILEHHQGQQTSFLVAKLYGAASSHILSLWAQALDNNPTISLSRT